MKHPFYDEDFGPEDNIAKFDDLEGDGTTVMKRSFEDDTEGGYGYSSGHLEMLDLDDPYAI